MSCDEATHERGDIELMQAVRQDDRAAFAELVRRHQRMLLNYFLRSGVQSDAEDLVQQTFLRLYRYRHRYRPSAKFTTFLFLLARQVWIDELRRRQRRQRLQEGLTLEAEVAEEGAAAPPPADLEGELERALASLSEGMRAVVVLGILQDLDYQQVADILKIPVGTVKSRMFNALRLMRAFLEEQP
jgi:RNA polymerase sigma-70 factor (ECF subfamily)